LSDLRNALISFPKSGYRFLYLWTRHSVIGGHRSPRRRRAGRRGLLRILHRFLTSCLPASLIIRSPSVGRQGARRPAGTEGQKSLDRLEPTLKVRHEMMLGKKIAPVQYLRAIRPSSPKWARARWNEVC